ncbi:ABC transporter permease, partial [Stenotrophomonas maltophilia]|uniref:ABC transporter permease n=1 Tax=Stenotrophomonas maltophilia TaxID=40324 RepID=UPI001EF857CD
MKPPSTPVRIAAWLAYAFMLTPLAVIVLFSFSDRSFFQFPPEGFSLKWYARAWDSGLFLWPALRSLVIGACATATAAALAISA